MFPSTLLFHAAQANIRPVTVRRVHCQKKKKKIAKIIPVGVQKLVTWTVHLKAQFVPCMPLKGAL